MPQSAVGPGRRRRQRKVAVRAGTGAVEERHGLLDHRAGAAEGVDHQVHVRIETGQAESGSGRLAQARLGEPALAMPAVKRRPGRVQPRLGPVARQLQAHGERRTVLGPVLDAVVADRLAHGTGDTVVVAKARCAAADADVQRATSREPQRPRNPRQMVAEDDEAPGGQLADADADLVGAAESEQRRVDGVERCGEADAARVRGHVIDVRKGSHFASQERLEAGGAHGVERLSRVPQAPLDGPANRRLAGRDATTHARAFVRVGRRFRTPRSVVRGATGWGGAMGRASSPKSGSNSFMKSRRVGSRSHVRVGAFSRRTIAMWKLSSSVVQNREAGQRPRFRESFLRLSVSPFLRLHGANRRGCPAT